MVHEHKKNEKKNIGQQFFFFFFLHLRSVKAKKKKRKKKTRKEKSINPGILFFRGK